jgi:hypothetical protein
VACLLRRHFLAAAQGRETAEVRTRKVTLEDLSTNEPVADKGTTTTVVVTRAAAKQEYTVPAEGRHGVSAETERRSVAW